MHFNAETKEQIKVNTEVKGMKRCWHAHLHVHSILYPVFQILIFHPALRDWFCGDNQKNSIFGISSSPTNCQYMCTWQLSQQHVKFALTHISFQEYDLGCSFPLEVTLCCTFYMLRCEVVSQRGVNT